MQKKNIWHSITEDLKSRVSQLEFSTWFSNISLKKFDVDQTFIEVPNKFIANWLSENYAVQIQDSFKNKLNIRPEITFIYKQKITGRGKQKYNNVQKTGINFDHKLDLSLTFSNFVTAKTNQFAFYSALNVAENPSKLYNPLYIFCNLSFGKTHLLNAIGVHVIQNNPFTKVKYFPADQFSFDFSLAKKKYNLDEFRNHYKALDFILLDDIHLFANRKKTQEEFTSLLKTFYESKKQIVIAGQKPPNQISNLLPELRSRLEWGLFSEILVPDQQTKMKIIKKKSQKDNLKIPDDVSFFLANFTNDLKTLIKYYTSLETYFSIYKREIDISTVKSIINRNLSSITLYDIQKATADHFNITISNLLSNKKGRNFSYPRQVAMYLGRTLTNLSYKKIGEVFGNRDHSTVIYAVKHIEKEKNNKLNILEDINKLNILLSYKA